MHYLTDMHRLPTWAHYLCVCTYIERYKNIVYSFFGKMGHKRISLGGLAVLRLQFLCRGHRFDPWSES